MGGQGSNAENANVAKASLHEKWMIKDDPALKTQSSHVFSGVATLRTLFWKGEQLTELPRKYWNSNDTCTDDTWVGWRHSGTETLKKILRVTVADFSATLICHQFSVNRVTIVAVGFETLRVLVVTKENTPLWENLRVRFDIAFVIS